MGSRAASSASVPRSTEALALDDAPPQHDRSHYLPAAIMCGEGSRMSTPRVRTTRRDGPAEIPIEQVLVLTKSDFWQVQIQRLLEDVSAERRMELISELEEEDP